MRELLLCEPVPLGRVAMDETVVSGLFEDRWRMPLDGSLIHAEQIRIGPDMVTQQTHAAVLGGAGICHGPLDPSKSENLLEPARAIIGEQGGASFWNGKLLARLNCTRWLFAAKRLIPLLSCSIVRQLCLNVGHCRNCPCN